MDDPQHNIILQWGVADMVGHAALPLAGCTVLSCFAAMDGGSPASVHTITASHVNMTPGAYWIALCHDTPLVPDGVKLP